MATRSRTPLVRTLENKMSKDLHVSVTRTIQSEDGTVEETNMDYRAIIMHTVVMTQFKTLFDLKCMNIRATLKSDLEYCVPFLQLHRFDQEPGEGHLEISLAHGYDSLTFTLFDHNEDKEHYLLDCKDAITLAHVDEAVNMAAHLLLHTDI